MTAGIDDLIALDATLTQHQQAAERGLRAAERLLRVKQSRRDLATFTELTMPDPDDPDDATRSRYSTQPFHRALADALEQVERGDILRLIITFPPRHGKSELTSRRFPAWYVGRDPYRHVIFGTYNDEFARDFGREVRTIMQSKTYRHVFPGCTLAKGEAAADRLRTEQGGLLAFVGVGGSTTGRGADVFIIDDPFKDDADAQSKAKRDSVWNWFQNVAQTRLMSHLGATIIIMTRWHDDDIVGRLLNSDNPHYVKAEAEKWRIINIPALAEENDVLGRKPGEALWPNRFPAEYLEGRRLANPRGFSALYQQRPSPEDGDHFTRDMLLGYEENQRPEVLRVYAASDHAVSTEQGADRTCLLIAGVDVNGNIWLLDAFWKKSKPKATAEAMVALIRKWEPVVWWAEKGHISKSLGPFVRDMMREADVFARIVEVTPSADKVQRATSIIGRASIGQLRIPKFAPWYQDAIDECLKFPAGRYDDFVDALAHLGMGLRKMRRPQGALKSIQIGPAVPGTFRWMKEDAAYRTRERDRSVALGGW